MAVTADKNGKTELSVLMSCHEYVVSVLARRIDRLLLADQVTAEPTKAGSGAVPILRVGDIRYAAWNLGKMLEVQPFKDAWVLLKVPHQGSELPLALGVGRCLLVSSVRDVTALPPGVFRSRRAALWGAFPTASIKGTLSGAVMGLCLDPLRLWTGDELEQSATALISARTA